MSDIPDDHHASPSESRPQAGARLRSRPSPVARAALHDQVVERLRDMILEGDIPPGERIPERGLCERLNISRTPLREALKVLAAEGLVQLQPHRGATVSRLSAEDLDHTFRVIEALEALAGELACARVTDAEVAELRELHARMTQHYRQRERPAYFQINQRIHHRIVEAAGNPALSEIYATLSRRIMRARYMANFSLVRWKQAIDEHEAMLAALAARDGARLSGILKQHLRHKREAVEVRLAAEDAD